MVQELASHNAEVTIQMCKVAQELAEYKAESKELKNQDGTIRRLEERVRSLEAQIQEKFESFSTPQLFLKHEGPTVSEFGTETEKQNKNGSRSVL